MFVCSASTCICSAAQVLVEVAIQIAKSGRLLLDNWCKSETLSGITNGNQILYIWYVRSHFGSTGTLLKSGQ